MPGRCCRPWVVCMDVWAHTSRLLPLQVFVARLLAHRWLSARQVLLKKKARYQSVKVNGMCVCMQEFTATLLDPCISEPNFQVRPMPLSYWQAVHSRLAAALHA